MVTMNNPSAKITVIIVFLALLITGCQKDLSYGEENRVTIYRNWLQQQPAGNMKEQVSINANGSPVSGHLNWQMAYTYQKDGYSYTSVPYIYTIKGRQSRYINGAKTAIVFRQQNGQIEARYTVASRAIQSRNDELVNGYDNIIYYRLNGKVDEVWFIDEAKSYKMDNAVFENGIRQKAGAGGRTISCYNFSFTYTTVQFAEINGVYGAIVTIHTDNVLFCTQGSSDEYLEPDNGDPSNWGSSGGGGNSSGPPPEPATDPCPTANQTAQSPVFNSNMNLLKIAADSSTVENGFYYQKNAAGVLSSSSLFKGIPDSPEVKIIVPPFTTIDGIMHSHFAGRLSIFSDVDFLSLFHLYDGEKIADVNSFASTIVTASGTTYMLKITDLDNFQAAVQQYFVSPDGSAALGAKFGFFRINSSNTAEMNEKNLLTFLRVTQIGVTLLKGEINTFGSWQKLSLGENNNIVVTPCN
jgi:hypothetical protein